MRITLIEAEHKKHFFRVAARSDMPSSEVGSVILEIDTIKIAGDKAVIEGLRDFLVGLGKIV